MRGAMDDVLERPDAAAWRPSEYTGFLMQAVLAATEGQALGSALELGVGSGVVLAALAQRGAGPVVGTDLDPGALVQARQLFDGIGCAAELLEGDLWEPLAGRRFDLVVANPPHFPMLAPGYAGRPRHWSFGGPDGRRVMDPLLRGLGGHLAEGGRAFVVHSAFLGMEATRRLLANFGLRARSVAASLMPLAPEKHAVMAPRVLHGAGPEAIRRIGGHAMLLTEVLEIRAVDGA